MDRHCRLVKIGQLRRKLAMVSDKQERFKGKDSIFNHPKPQHMTVKQKAEKSNDDELKKTIPNKCIGIGCRNQVTMVKSEMTGESKCTSAWCKKHQ